MKLNLLITLKGRQPRTEHARSTRGTPRGPNRFHERLAGSVEPACILEVHIMTTAATIEAAVEQQDTQQQTTKPTWADCVKLFDKN